MKLKIFSRTALFAILTGFIFFAALYFYVIPRYPIQINLSSLTINSSAKKASFGVPLLLVIPKIDVTAPIDPMGVTLAGAMQAPAGPKNVGWFKFGPTPGDKGSAVIDGHYGPWKNGGGSVFDNLDKLKAGDKIYVQDAAGATITFVVTKVVIYDPNKDASEVFYSSDGQAHLNLVTCEGIWDKANKTYFNRLVVFADKVQ